MRAFLVALITAAWIGAGAGIAAAAGPAPTTNWTGFYIGPNAGWNWIAATTTTQVIAAHNNTFSDFATANGAIAGLQLGYNWQGASNWILGIEADIQASGVNATSNPDQVRLNTGFGAVITESFSHTDTLEWLGTLRGRIGYALWQDTMLYASGGLAYGRVTESTPAVFTDVTINKGLTTTTTSSVFGESAVRTGWTVGGGIESIVPATHASLKLEYLYVNLGSASFSFNETVFGNIPVANATSFTFTDHIVRVGLNWRFN